MRTRGIARGGRELALLFSFALGAVGCGSHTAGTGTCANETRALSYAPNLSQPGQTQQLTFTLLSSDPGPPLKGDNMWMLRVTDAGGAPVDGATLKLTPFMPDHGHGTTVPAVVTPAGGGVYHVDPVNLFMAGLWQVTVQATTTGGVTDSAVFAFCIEG